MSLTLIGSQTSPFARRIRILMENLAYEFKELNIFEGEEAIALNRINPTNQIPVLLDGERAIWDSRQIFNYLNHTHRFQRMGWEEENLLTAIDGAMNSAVSILLMKRSGMKIDEPYMFVSRQRERIESVLDYLRTYLGSEKAREWNFHTISLYCFLDWGQYRELLSLRDRPECMAFMKLHENRDIVKKTQIPKVA